ncbi:hypothetical protein [Planctobacterium marinum]|uniref:hypothetical protein n=1 Tax=Planctobacterium marinum TaxID=1631968 RepID=UPI001E3FD57E|nr:hypothetical protein [Planctobacterium marinum]MCC2604193.1 hypothetical protein [Planctobacterium marinum]
MLFYSMAVKLGQNLSQNVRSTGKRMLPAIIFLILPFFAQPEPQVISIASSLDDYDISTYLDEFKQQSGIDYEFVALDTADLKMELIIRADTKTLPDAVLVPGDLLGLEMVNFSEIPQS